MYDFIEVNLLPAEYRVHRRAIRLEPIIVIPMVVVGAVSLGLVLYQGVLGTEAMRLRNEIMGLDAQIRINAPIEQEIQALSEEKKVIVGKIMALERISVNRAKWVRLLETLCRYLPPYSWLVGVKESSAAPPTLVLQGQTRSFPEVATYMTDLRKSEFITAIELTKIEQTGDADKSYGFEIVCTINPNAGLTTEQE